MFTLPELTYPYDALEPHIDARTMQIHHDLHHGGYVNKLNAALEDREALKTYTIEDLITKLDTLPELIRTAVRNNGGGHYNHTLFWETMGPNGGDGPSGALDDAIRGTFGSFETFQDTFNQAALGRFGSGWAWLVVEGDGKLAVTSTPNQDNPLTNGETPILGLDVWEHAYYLHYQNRRPDYVKAWWQVVNWGAVSARFDSLKG